MKLNKIWINVWWCKKREESKRNFLMVLLWLYNVQVDAYLNFILLWKVFSLLQASILQVKHYDINCHRRKMKMAKNNNVCVFVCVVWRNTLSQLLSAGFHFYIRSAQRKHYDYQETDVQAHEICCKPRFAWESWNLPSSWMETNSQMTSQTMSDCTHCKDSGRF